MDAECGGMNCNCAASSTKYQGKLKDLSVNYHIGECECFVIHIPYVSMWTSREICKASGMASTSKPLTSLPCGSRNACTLGMYWGMYHTSGGCMVIHMPFGGYLSESTLGGIADNTGIVPYDALVVERTWFR